MRFVSLLILIAAFAALAFGQNEQSPMAEKPFGYNDWTFKNVKGGGETNLRTFAKDKKLVMVVYWAPWCPNWRHDVAFVESLHAKYAGRGLGVIGVGVYDSTGKMKDFIEKNKVTFPSVYETENLNSRLTSAHYQQRTLAGDTRKWGSPWYVILDPATFSPSGAALTSSTTVVNGELIKDDVEKYIAGKLGK